MDVRIDQVLLASGYGEDTGGGIFACDGCTATRLDSLSSTGLYVVGGHLWRLLRSTDDGNSVGEVLLYDRHGVRRYLRLDTVGDGHDILWDGQHLIIVSTNTNTVYWIAPDGAIARQWTAPGYRDAWHLNSLILKDGALLASAFGRFEAHREWTRHLHDATGIVFNLSTGEDILNGLDGPHHPRFVDGAWIICNSANHEILEIDAESGETLRRLALAGWTRGVAVSDDFMFVGESALRHQASGNATASIAVVDRRTWDLLDRVPLPCREIYDLVLVPSARADGVRRGFRTNPLRVAEQDRRELFAAVGIDPARLWANGDPLRPEACKVALTADVPTALPAGAMVGIDVRLENRGDAILVSAPPHPVHLSYKWVDARSGRQAPDTEGLRTVLPAALPPGERVACRCDVQAPPHAGRYILRLTLVQEHVAWFDDLDAANAHDRPVRIVA